MAFSGYGFILGTILAEREGVSAQAATRIGLIGGVLGFSATGLIATSILAQREAQSEAASSVVAATSTTTTALIAVPDVTGKSFNDASQILTSTGLVVKRQEAYNAEIAKEQVFGVTPTAGTLVSSGSTVTLIVSIGPVVAQSSPGQVTVPNVSDGTMTFDKARERLQDETLGIVDPPPTAFVTDPKQAGMVISQDPKAGTVVNIPYKVTLTVGVTQSVPEMNIMPSDSETKGHALVGKK